MPRLVARQRSLLTGFECMDLFGLLLMWLRPDANNLVSFEVEPIAEQVTTLATEL